MLTSEERKRIERIREDIPPWNADLCWLVDKLLEVDTECTYWKASLYEIQFSFPGVVSEAVRRRLENRLGTTKENHDTSG